MPEGGSPRRLLVQLPLNTAAPLEPTGNLPMGPAVVAAAAGLPPGCIAGPGMVDELGDRALAERVAESAPDLIALTLYCWNVERSVALARSLRGRLPRTVLIAGGPEVQPDNAPLLESEAFDLLVCGEGEPMARHILDPSRAGILAGSPGGMIEIPPSTFPPEAYPDPWAAGLLDPASYGSVSIETVRGCSSGCIFCSYRRRHPDPRMMTARHAVSRCAEMVRAGASEIVFLDPTFNARPDLDVMLEGLAVLRTSLFAEMRGEGITPELARAFAAAGFASVEIGLQTSSQGALSACGRPGSFAKAVDGAEALSRAGVRPVLDFILGLPGDAPDGPVEALRRIVRRGFDFDAQVFFLAALPGTEARVRGRELDLEWMDGPPYYVTRSGRYGFDDLSAAREEMADILGYDLDFRPRPLLFDGSPATVEIDLDQPLPASSEVPSFRHGALRLRAGDPWSRRDVLLDAVRQRRHADPFCVLDAVVVPASPFPLDLVDSIRSLDSPVDYGGRVAGLHGLEGNLRVSVLLEDWRAFPEDWIAAAAGCCTVVADVRSLGDFPAGLLEQDAGIRLPGDGHDLAALAASVPLEDRVFFRSRLMEQLWTEGILQL